MKNVSDGADGGNISAAQRADILSRARAQIEGSKNDKRRRRRGQPVAAYIAHDTGIKHGLVLRVLRELDSEGLLGRRCSEVLRSTPTRAAEPCWEPLPAVALGHLQQTRCGCSHLIRNGERVRAGEARVRDYAEEPAPAPASVPSAAEPNDLPAVEPVATSSALAPLTFDGAALEVVEADGERWVTLRSAFAPFGKEVDKQMPSLKGWLLWAGTPDDDSKPRPEMLGPDGKPDDMKGENLRKVWFRPAGGTKNRGGIRTPVWAVRIDLLAMVIAKLDTLGMPGDLAPKHARWTREIGGVVDDYMTKGVAVNPRIAAPVGTDPVLLAILQNQSRLLEVLVSNQQTATAPRARLRAVEPVDSAQTVIRIDGATVREPNPMLMCIGQLQQHCAFEGCPVSDDTVRRVGLALHLIGDADFGGDRSVTDCDRVLKIGWGLNRLGRDALFAAVKAYKERGASLDDFLDEVEPVGVGAWPAWQQTRQKPRVGAR